MNVKLDVSAGARPTRVSGEQPPLDISIRLEVRDAKRGDAVTGAIEKSLGEANKAVAKVLETRRY